MQRHVSAFSFLLDMKFHHQINWDLGSTFHFKQIQCCLWRVLASNQAEGSSVCLPFELDRGSRGRPLAPHLQRRRIIIRWNLAVWRVIYQSHRGFTSLVWHRCGVEGRELISPGVWRVRITCTSHLWWPPEWKIKYSVPILPPVVSWPLGREGRVRKRKWEMNKNALSLQWLH